MLNTDFDPEKFEQDAYGSLIPKDGYEAGETYGKDVIPDIEQDAEIMNEYGLED